MEFLHRSEQLGAHDYRHESDGVEDHAASRADSYPLLADWPPAVQGCPYYEPYSPETYLEQVYFGYLEQSSPLGSRGSNGCAWGLNSACNSEHAGRLGFYDDLIDGYTTEKLLDECVCGAVVSCIDSTHLEENDELPDSIGDEMKIHWLSESGRMLGLQQNKQRHCFGPDYYFVSSLANSPLSESSELMVDQSYLSESASTPTSPDSEVSRTDCESGQTDDDTTKEGKTDLVTILSKSARIRRREGCSREGLSAKPFFTVAPSKRRKLKEDDCDYENKRKRIRRKRNPPPNSSQKRKRQAAPEPVYQVAPDFDKATWKDAASVVSWHFVEEAPETNTLSLIVSRSH